MSQRMAETILAIVRHRLECGISPTYEELGIRLGIKKSTVSAHVRKLRKIGLLEPGEKRGRTLVPKNCAVNLKTGTVYVPIYTEKEGWNEENIGITQDADRHEIDFRERNRSDTGASGRSFDCFGPEVD